MAKKFIFKGKKLPERNRILKEAKLLQEAGIFSVVLECIETKLSKKITEQLKIPTIGIGSSVNCDGQILVTDDIIGLSGFYPKFVKRYANLNSIIEKAVKKYSKEIKTNVFPSKVNFLYGK